MGSLQVNKLHSALILMLVALVSQTDAWWFSASSQPAARQTNPSAVAATAAAAAEPAQGQQQNNKEIKAIAEFDLDGIKGAFKFSQRSPKDKTYVEYDLTGLHGNNKLYHVHERPVPAHDHEQMKSNWTMIAELCGPNGTGGHLNPFNIKKKLPPKSAPFDQYEMGDLSGKHGPLELMSGKSDRYVGKFSDDNLPMTGKHSIVGRSLVIHKDDGKRLCASIVPIA